MSKEDFFTTSYSNNPSTRMKVRPVTTYTEKETTACSIVSKKNKKSAGCVHGKTWKCYIKRCGYVGTGANKTK